jgi:choline-glycine betaine transporter
MSEKKKMLDPEGVKATVIDSYKPEGALFGFLKELPLYSIVAPISLVLIMCYCLWLALKAEHKKL